MIQAPGDALQLRLDQVQRVFARLLPAGSIASAGNAPLELIPEHDPAVIGASEPLEPADAAPRRISGEPAEKFAAFLDGTQRTEVVGHTPDGEAVLLGTVGAVIRAWQQERAHTWRHLRSQQVYAPLGVLPDDVRSALEQLPVPVQDTVEREASGDAHPHARRDGALRAVRRAREALEVELLRAWLSEEPRPLYVDGGLSASVRFPRAEHAVGVVKSHHTLYAAREARRVVLGLRQGERGPAFLVGQQRAAPLASWYLRLHDPVAHDPFWGLVRVEVLHNADSSLPALTAHVDDVSRRVLAERTPTAHPDARWAVMAYGVRDCEVFLRATQ